MPRLEPRERLLRLELLRMHLRGSSSGQGKHEAHHLKALIYRATTASGHTLGIIFLMYYLLRDLYRPEKTSMPNELEDLNRTLRELRVLLDKRAGSISMATTEKESIVTDPDDDDVCPVELACSDEPKPEPPRVDPVSARMLQGFTTAFFVSALLRIFGAATMGFGIAQLLPTGWAPIALGAYMLGAAKLYEQRAAHHLQLHQQLESIKKQ